MGELVSGREYARRRGVSHTAVRKAIESGRIAEAVKAGKIDVDIANAKWSANTDQAQQRDAAALRARSSAGQGAQGKLFEEKKEHPEQSKQAALFNTSKAVRESYRAKKERLETEKLEGSLVPRAKVDAALFRKGRTVRDSILTVPDRLCAELAAETDAARVRARLYDELEAALLELSSTILPDASDAEE